MTKKRVRSVPIYVWVRPDELEVIRERMEMCIRDRYSGVLPEVPGLLSAV